MTGFSLRPLPPFRLDLTVWALRRRSGNAVDMWDGETYRRVLAIGDKPVLVAVTQQATTLKIVLTGEDLPPADRQATELALDRLLGIRVDLSGFYEFTSRHSRLDHLAAPFRGLKPPRFATVFEGLVNGITCQQLSLTVGIAFLNRLAERCGLAFNQGLHAFPRPEDLAHLHPEDLRPLGYSGSKARSIIGVARAVVDGHLDLEVLAQLNNQECLERLVAIPGIGRWTAEYVLLRGSNAIRTHAGLTPRALGRALASNAVRFGPAAQRSAAIFLLKISDSPWHGDCTCHIFLKLLVSEDD
jgi:DNA-3-methyladenine glycosylase II